jgi:hypothetical protein
MTEKLRNRTRPVLRLLEVRHMPSLIDDVQLRIRYRGMQLPGQGHREAHVLGPVQYQRRTRERPQDRLGVGRAPRVQCPGSERLKPVSGELDLSQQVQVFVESIQIPDRQRCAVERPLSGDPQIRQFAVQLLKGARPTLVLSPALQMRLDIGGGVWSSAPRHRVRTAQCPAAVLDVSPLPDGFRARVGDVGGG